jgi:hypothetical protein
MVIMELQEQLWNLWKDFLVFHLKFSFAQNAVVTGWCQNVAWATILKVSIPLK